MLEALKELIPLLEGVKDGAIWLVVAYFGVVVFKLSAWIGLFTLIVCLIYRFANRVLAREGVETVSWYALRMGRGPERISLVAPQDDFRTFLKLIANRYGNVGTTELNKAIEKLRQ